MMVGSKRKLVVATICYIGVLVCGIWVSPSIDASGNAGIRLPSAAKGPSAGDMVAMAAPAYRGAKASAFIGETGRGSPQGSAYRRVLERIAAARNKWVPMTAMSNYAPMTPVPPRADTSPGRQAMVPAYDVTAAPVDPAYAYQ